MYVIPMHAHDPDDIKRLNYYFPPCYVNQVTDLFLYAELC